MIFNVWQKKCRWMNNKSDWNIKMNEDKYEERIKAE